MKLYEGKVICLPNQPSECRSELRSNKLQHKVIYNRCRKARLDASFSAMSVRVIGGTSVQIQACRGHSASKPSTWIFALNGDSRGGQILTCQNVELGALS